MNNYIVGTAGHVDHGKTCLIKALTGVDTDRLAEEKKRGITIELGFAQMPNEENLNIGIVDVPGHEKFVKNMLAGAGGIDLVLLVIGIDEGVMPQTREHLDILTMLNIKHGIIVLTKCDLVDEEWGMMVEEDVRELVKGTFLEDAPILPVSAFTGKNLPELKDCIFRELKKMEEKRQEEELFRLPIDRVFTMDGFGTVVTGTVIDGSISVGQEIMIYPNGIRARIRGIQNHGRSVEKAFAGQRTAINLTGVRKDKLKRGDILACEGGLQPSLMSDVRITMFADTEKTIKNNDRLHFYYGSAQNIAKVVLLDKDELKAGESGIAQLHFTTPVAIKHNDRFIVRFFSPMESIGGGSVIDPEAVRHKRKRAEILASLEQRSCGELLQELSETVRASGLKLSTSRELARHMNLTVVETEALLEQLKKKKVVLSLRPGGFIHKECWNNVSKTAKEVLENYHQENPIQLGMEKEEFRITLCGKMHIDGDGAEILMQELVKRKEAVFAESKVALVNFKSGYSDELTRMKKEIYALYIGFGSQPQTNEEVCGKFKDKKQAKQIIADLSKNEKLVKVNSEYYILKEVWDKALQVVDQHLKNEGQITLGQFRDEMGATRKYGMLLLETFDSMKITKLVGDVRVAAK